MLHLCLCFSLGKMCSMQNSIVIADEVYGDQFYVHFMH